MQIDLKLPSVACAFLFIFLHAGAQNDSAVFANANWKTQKVAKGVRLKHFWFEGSLFHSNQNINILEVTLTGKNKADIEGDRQQLLPTSTFGRQGDALAAINGTFFDIRNGGSVDYVRINGIPINTTRLAKNSSRTFHQKAAIVIRDKKVDILPWNGSPSWEEELVAEDAMVTGPLLLYGGASVPLDTTSFYTTRHPRSAVAIKGKKLYLITADGRNEKAAGLRLSELALLLRWLNVDKGVNLDGGGSTTLWIAGFPDGGIVNHPSDNKKAMATSAYKKGMDLDDLPADTKRWDTGDERPVANVLVIRQKK